MAVKLPSFDFGKIKDIFSFRSRSFLGIDVGTSAIRLVELSRRKSVFSLTNYGEVHSSALLKNKPFRIFYKNSVALSNKEVAQAISSIVEEAGIQTKEVSFSVPDFASFFTSFEIPAMDEDEIPQAIQYEVRPYVPLPVDEVTLDWVVIAGQPSSTPLKVLVVAVPNDVVAQYQEIAQMAGLELKTLESEVFALARAANKYIEKKDDAKKVIGLLDLGARSTTCSIIEKGVLKSSHSFHVGGNELTEIVAKSLNIDYNRSEELKLEIGLIPQGKKDLRSVLAPLIDSILGEAKEVFRVFFMEEGREVEKVILSGGVSMTPGFKEYCAASFKKPVVALSPFLNINHPKVLEKNLQKMNPFYAIAVGLALKGLEK